MSYPSFNDQPTAGEMPAIRPTTAPLTQSPYSVTPLPPVAPVTPLPVSNLHSTHRTPRPPTDQLSSHSQETIQKYAAAILDAVNPHCIDCRECRHCMEILLADFTSEIMTDVSIITLSLGRQQREFERLNELLRRVLEGKK